MRPKAGQRRTGEQNLHLHQNANASALGAEHHPAVGSEDERSQSKDAVAQAAAADRTGTSIDGSLVPKGDGIVHLLRGREAILGSKPILDELARMSGQAGVLTDLAYHLSGPYAQKNPCLILIGAEAGVSGTTETVDGYVGAMLLFEYRIFGLGLRLFTTGDTTGRRTLIAPAECRARVAAYASMALLGSGAEIVLTTFQREIEDHTATAGVREMLRRRKNISESRAVPKASWALLERTNPLYLPLKATFDDTLAIIGQKTRFNLRYYRRRAEKQLGCSFVPEVRISLEEFLAFNRECSFAVPDDVARWRYESLSQIERPFLQGVHGADGKWLSIVGGRRTEDFTELEWQCNRADLPSASLSTVMRAYLIEHEVKLGMTRLYIEGGTPTSLQQSFVVEGAADLTFYRRSLYAWLFRKFAVSLFPPKNYLARMLKDNTLIWERTGR